MLYGIEDKTNEVAAFGRIAVLTFYRGYCLFLRIIDHSNNSKSYQVYHPISQNYGKKYNFKIGANVSANKLYKTVTVPGNISYGPNQCYYYSKRKGHAQNVV
jgi:hypothetical protein